MQASQRIVALGITWVVGVGGRDLEHVFDMGEDLTQLKVRIAKEAAAKRSRHALSHEEMERLYLRKAPRPASSRRRKKAA